MEVEKKKIEEELIAIEAKRIEDIKKAEEWLADLRKRKLPTVGLSAMGLAE